MYIRRFQKKDSQSILSLGNNFELTPYCIDKKFSALTDIKIPFLVKKQLSMNNIHILVACVDENVVGFVSYTVETSLSEYIQKKCASILFLSVDKKFQRQGIGSNLLQACLKELRKDNILLVRIATDLNNHALSLYEKFGFTKNLTWHIYRLYNNGMQGSKIDDKQEHLNINQFPQKSLLNRPFSWFYIPNIDVDKVYQFLKKKVIDQIQKKEIYWIYRKIGDLFLSLTIRRDKSREEYYGIKGTLWTISDLYEHNGNDSELFNFIKSILNMLPKFVMVEYWVCDQDIKTQNVLVKSDFQKIYTGIALSKYIR